LIGVYGQFAANPLPYHLPNGFLFFFSEVFMKKNGKGMKRKSRCAKNSGLPAIEEAPGDKCSYFELMRLTKMPEGGFCVTVCITVLYWFLCE
jgi:hypothetical protein